MDQIIENDFNVFLPSNASMDLFRNTPDNYRTKLAQPITLRGYYEVALSEITLPGRFFTVQKDYNDSYSIEKNTVISEISTLPEILLNISDTSDLVEGINNAVEKAIDDIIPLKVEHLANNLIQWNLMAHWRMNIDKESAPEIMQSLARTRPLNIAAKDKPSKFPYHYSKPKKTYKNQIIKLTSTKPIEKYRKTITITHDIDRDVFDIINENILKIDGENYAIFEYISSENVVLVSTLKHVDIFLESKTCPKLMNMLNIRTDSHIIRGETKFPYTRIDNLTNETFQIIVNSIFIREKYEKTRTNYRIPQGMYRNSKDLFLEFKSIKLKELPDQKTLLIVPPDMIITFGDKLKDLLGFVKDKFESGTYASEYNLELSAGITEVYVYTDIINPSLVGNAYASILKIVPIANEKSEQIVKHFAVPLYFTVKKHHFDTIHIELRTSQGTPIKFISGKTSLVLSFRKRN